MERLVHLTKEQERVLNLAKQGHNICVIGKAGVGKTTTVLAIKEALETNENVQIICSTGIACESYGGIAKTVHSQYGLRLTELPSQLLIERSLGQNVTVKQVADTTVLIWDEVSMSSTRIFEIVNKIHHMVSQNNLAFGGIQVILVGDFLQLKPIPSPFDEGKSIYLSELFDKVFPHRIELTEVLRQGEGESRLKNLLDMLRNGECSEEAEEYVHSLERECMQDAEKVPIHIYFRKLNVEIHNGNVLQTLPGLLETIESIDHGSTHHLEKTAPRTLSLKPGCQIMLIYNINDQLKNGYQGRYVGKDPNDDNALLVHFPKVGTIPITRRTWYNYDVDGKVQGSRTQFPLTLYYAITVYKSQSLTLESIVVHCAQEFVPGQTYVAVSRVRSEKNLQIIGFQRRFLLPPPDELANMVTFCVDPDETLSCCRNHHLDHSFFEDNTCHYSTIQSAAEMDEVLDRDENLDVDAALQSEIFCQPEEQVTVKPEDTLLCLLPLSHIAALPTTFNMQSFLTSAVVDVDDPFSQSINSAARYAIDHLEAFQLLANIIWVRIAILFQKHTSLTNKEFTFATTQVHKMFSSNEYQSDLLTAFQLRRWTDIDDGKRTLGVQLTFHLYQLFVTEVEKALKHEDVHTRKFNVKEMGVSGLGKLRYVGGWAIHKCLASCKRYLMAHKHSQSNDVRKKLNNELRKIDLLDSNIIIPYVVLEKTTSHAGTLNITESRQHRQRGLLHITDEAFQFFLALEQERVNLISFENLSSLKDQMIDQSIKSVLENKSIQDEFVSLFDLKLDGDKAS